ncbi:S-layer homology domain-containing protein [Lysinibacillus fusiformis]|uniref:S-layer homology domain-containing protein n=1 Tax=Lysinibacillus fusiformis TaxID=28031 RepID=UPI00215B64DC|nr:S-layer homology domain-containing protein [Lysinibacillus fusiformis]MCR8855733.1 S-layer homology domain-containing protein [Lysinibacillus fusiformis]
MKNSTALYDKLFKAAMATSAIAVVASNMTKNANEEVFTDVKTTSDYYEYVNELFERGFVNG